MSRLVWTTDGVEFVVRDAGGFLHYPTPRELHKYATAKEVREATHRYEASQTPLPSYDPSSGLYYWTDRDDLWPEEDVIDDINKLWPGMDANLLLLSARLMAALGITD
jgi:hypothetical protein